TILQFSSLGSIFGYKVDVSNYDEVQHIATKTKQEIGNIDILINNAGIVVGKYFHEHSQKDILKTIEINTNAPMVITN
ncbi:SDR family NAD(P)-dependent oxidoreductase, partial [Escherichia coli]|nr:SDR family NAD(P)-dependent oxidoreductase [Escherichia coli]